ncbi:hypothetical protein H8959_009578, partial [Pygathrix nigripes]
MAGLGLKLLLPLLSRFFFPQCSLKRCFQDSVEPHLFLMLKIYNEKIQEGDDKYKVNQYTGEIRMNSNDRKLYLHLPHSRYLVLQSTWTLKMPLCGHKEVDHFFCEVPALLKLPCVETTANEAELFFISVLFLLIPMTLVLISYAFIVQAVLRIQSAEGRRKAFGTCGSHLIVVSPFYGTAISMYLQPPSPSSKDRGKIVSLFYGIIAPMLNPLIYTLRNKE